MAIYYMNINNSNNAKQYSVVKGQDHHDYIVREGKYSSEKEVKGEEHLKYIQRQGAFSNKEKYEDLLYSENNNMPSWAKEDPNKFWIAADMYEGVNRVRYHNFELTLPNEFSDEENIKLVKKHCEKILGKDFPYSFGIHKKKARNGEIINIHVHLMFSDRKLDGIDRPMEQFFKKANTKYPERGGTKKDRKWNQLGMYRRERKNWENSLNEELVKKGLEKVSCETLEKQLELARENKDIIKEIYCDRPPVNCNGRILQKLDKYGMKSLTKKEKTEYENYLISVKMRDESLKAIEKIKELLREKENEELKDIDNELSSFIKEEKIMKN